jgi:hypothetical protein
MSHLVFPSIKLVLNFTGPGIMVDGHHRTPWDYVTVNGGTRICVVDLLSLWLQEGDRTPAEAYAGRRYLEHHLGCVFAEGGRL